MIKYDDLRDLVSFVQFKKREKHLCYFVTPSVKLQASVYNFDKINTSPWVFCGF